MQDSARKGETREQVSQDRRKQALRWSGLVVSLLLLLSLASAGFFLYSALVILALLPLSALIASTNLLGIEVERTLSEELIELGQVAEGRLSLKNQRKGLAAPWLYCRENIDPGLDVEGPASVFRKLAPGSQIHLSYRLHPLRRGLFRIGPSILEASGPFGLFRRFLIDSQARFLTVRPRVIAIGHGVPLGALPVHQVPRRRSLFEDPSRFQGIRQYRVGDSLRRIHWRATARSNRLQVKLFEPSVLQGLLLALDLSLDSFPQARSQRKRDSKGEEKPELDPIDPHLELAITCAASLADYVLSGGQRVGLLSNGADAAESFTKDWAGASFRRLDGVMELPARRRLVAERPLEVEPGRGEAQKERIQSALARLLPAPGFSLARLLDSELPQLPRSLVLLVITPRLDLELVTTLERVHRSGLEVGVVWIRPPGEALPEAELPTLPAGIPVYSVGHEDDLLTFGGAPI